jgi:hypothetical protein
MRFEIKAVLVACAFVLASATYIITEREKNESRPVYSGKFEVLHLFQGKTMRAQIQSAASKDAPIYYLSFSCGWRELLVQTGKVYTLQYQIDQTEDVARLVFFSPFDQFCGY